MHPKGNDRVEKEMLWDKLLQAARLGSVISAEGIAVIDTFSFTYRSENYRLLILKNDSDFVFKKKVEKVSKDIRSQLESERDPKCVFLHFKDYLREFSSTVICYEPGATLYKDITNYTFP